ncbi:hypothetical protein DLD82_02430 [Methanospirillum stamsii]|uniref:Glycosyltransferase RgtA/B/C/D-like domain-containing protein n=3 Tax=Methanospirillum stamsii TaxID=1277351 RepID=A0A2V2NBG4_9EURY|nr:hypothetical protein DLD82_02430 [Methanospirillum stamsii]
MTILILINPIIFLNDEWISTSQLSQLSQHHQILYNEGKYGFFQNETPNSYFSSRNNMLPYTSFIPLISYPFLLITKFLGDVIPYYVSLAFSGILIIFALSLNMTKRAQLSYLLIFFSFTVLLLNIFFFKPINISSDSVHFEVFAIVLMNMFFFLCLIGIVYIIFKNLLSDPLYAVFGTYVSIACSSYLFWVNTCKDHLVTATMFAMTILFLTLYIQKSDQWYLFSSFICTGLLAWIRPEVGAFIFLIMVFLLLFFYFTNNFQFQPNKRTIFLFLCPIGTIIGIIPLFISNILVTGHPLVLPFQLLKNYSNNQDFSTNSTLTVSQVPETQDMSASGFSDSILSILYNVVERIMPDVPMDTFLGNVYGVFISPSTLKVPVLAIVPIFLIGIGFLPKIYSIIHENKKNESTIIFSLLMVSVGIFCAYLTSIAGLHTSIGIFPDVRYLSPVYIPLNIIGILLVSKVFNKQIIHQILQFSVLFSVIGPVIILFILFLVNNTIDFWSVFLWMNGIITLLIYLVMLLFFIFLVGWYAHKIDNGILVYPISFLIALPLIWQISMILIIQCYLDTPYYYPPLLPIVREFLPWIAGFQ